MRGPRHALRWISEKYQIGPEDLLFIRVWREPDFTLPVAVRPDGKITMPLIGEVPAAGQSPLAADSRAQAAAAAVSEQSGS